MRRFLVIGLAVCLLIPGMTRAQHPGWPVVQQCVVDWPSEKLTRDQWDFEGVIFIEDIDGIHALRADYPPYFIAYDDDASAFASVGAFSPDGRWFAYPAGRTSEFATFRYDTAYGVEEIRIVSTGPRQNMIRIPWLGAGLGYTAREALDPVEWITDSVLLAHGWVDDGGGLIDVTTAEVLPWDQETRLDTLVHFSPDLTRAIHFTYDDNIRQVYDVEHDAVLIDLAPAYAPLAWLPDASGFVTTVAIESDPGRRELGIFDRDGQMIEIIASADRIRIASFSASGEKLAFTLDDRLYVADFAEKRVIDYCVTVNDQWFKAAWAPDGNALAFVPDFYPVLLNIDTLEIEILNYSGSRVWGWATPQQ